MKILKQNSWNHLKTANPIATVLLTVY